MKNILLLIFVIFLLGESVAQTKRQRVTSARENIVAFLKTFAMGDYKINGYILDVDSSQKSNRLGLYVITDPYLTLTNAFLFAAKKENRINSVFRFGIMRGGNTLWLSDSISLPNDATCDFVYVADLNSDNRVDIITNWSYGFQGSQEESWIYSWDGQTGNCINATDTSGHSEIKGLRRTLDLNNDGILELETLIAEIDDEGRIESEKRTYHSWNGFLYGTWPDTPTSDGRMFTVANALSIRIKSIAVSPGAFFNYKYNVFNSESSKLPLKHLYFSISATVFEGLGPSGWRFGKRDNSSLYGFVAMAESISVRIGQTADGFTISADGLPSVGTFYAQGPFMPLNMSLTDTSRLGEAAVNNILSNSFVGKTLVPRPFPIEMANLSFLDTLISYKHQALNLGWIKDNGIATSLDQKLDNAKAQLARNNKTSAKNILQAFINEVEAQKDKHLTSEAYALLKFNAEYLMSKL